MMLNQNEIRAQIDPFASMATFTNDGGDVLLVNIMPPEDGKKIVCDRFPNATSREDLEGLGYVLTSYFVGGMWVPVIPADADAQTGLTT